MDPGLDLNIRFVSDESRFEKALAELFGRLVSQKDTKPNWINNGTNFDPDSNLIQGLSRQQQLMNPLQFQQFQQYLSNFGLKGI